MTKNFDLNYILETVKEKFTGYDFIVNTNGVIYDGTALVIEVKTNLKECIDTDCLPEDITFSFFIEKVNGEKKIVARYYEDLFMKDEKVFNNCVEAVKWVA